MQSRYTKLADVLAAFMPMLALAASPLSQVREVSLAANFMEPAGWNVARGHPIIDLAFSPDGTTLAATMDNHFQDGASRTHLFIVDVGNPQAAVRRFDVDTCGQPLAFAPEGASIIVCGRVLRLRDGSSCRPLLANQHEQAVAKVLGTAGYWLDAHRVILPDRTVTDLACRPIDKWTIDGEWSVAGTLPSKSLILLSQSNRTTLDGRLSGTANYAIADIGARKMTSRLLLQDVWKDFRTILADGPGAVCSELIASDQSIKRVHRCWNLPGGEDLPLTAELADYRITSSSSSSPRVVAERWGAHFVERVLPNEGSGEILSLIVVDLRSGRQIVTMKPRLQHGNVSPLGPVDQYFRDALSPNGDLLAEGGDGILRLYRLP
jgi:hypothetical protein